MGLHRDFCFFIVFEQLVLGNYQIVRSIDHFTNYGFQSSSVSYWAQMSTSIFQILVAAILTQGLLERKIGKFLPWLLVNAVYCCGISVTTIVIFFDTSYISEIFSSSSYNGIIYSVTLIVAVLQWIMWITVLMYYRHLKLKEIERQKNSKKDENDENPTERTVFMQTPKMFDNPPRNVQFCHHEKEITLPMNRLYPVPTAPEIVI